MQQDVPVPVDVAQAKGACNSTNKLSKQKCFGHLVVGQVVLNHSPQNSDAIYIKRLDHFSRTCFESLLPK